jgi:hypothetical protein
MYYGNHSHGAPPPYTGIKTYYDGVIGGWNWLDNASLTHADRRRAAVRRGRQVARAAAAACPGLQIVVYNPYTDLAALGWMAGLATPGGGADISKVVVWAAGYNQDRAGRWTTMSRPPCGTCGTTSPRTAHSSTWRRRTYRWSRPARGWRSG